jgi:small subunit ribosomal protein S8
MKDVVSMPASKQKTALADVLTREGSIEGFSVSDASTGPAKVLTIRLKYSDDRQRTISGIKRVSTPGLRVYRAATEVPRVLGGLGVAVLSTSQGLMTDREARQRKVGGEVMCFVW